MFIVGGRDPHGGAIITFPSSANTDFVAEEFDKLMRFVSSVPRCSTCIHYIE